MSGPWTELVKRGSGLSGTGSHGNWDQGPLVGHGRKPGPTLWTGNPPAQVLRRDGHGLTTDRTWPDRDPGGRPGRGLDGGSWGRRQRVPQEGFIDGRWRDHDSLETSGTLNFRPDLVIVGFEDGPTIRATEPNHGQAPGQWWDGWTLIITRDGYHVNQNQARTSGSSNHPPLLIPGRPGNELVRTRKVRWAGTPPRRS
jgi:hypothetical protein